MKSQKIFILSGEPSGDLHGAELAVSLKKLNPTLELEGICGPLMCQQGVKPFLHNEEFQVMGFLDVLYVLPKLIKNFYKILKYLLNTKPDIVVLIDYQEFNLLLASKLRKKNFKGKIIQYISPSVWAWRPNRAKIIEKNCDILFTIYPFENQYYSDKTLIVKYIGNPIYEKVLKYNYNLNWKEQFFLEEKPIISIFPGSRKQEIINNLPLHIKALEQIENKYNFCISYHNQRSKSLIEDYLKKHKHRNSYSLIPSLFNYELMKESIIALAKSGTVTLELAFHKIPTIVTYEISSLHKYLCKNILKINLPFYCIVNILGKKKIFTEFIESNINPQDVSKELFELLNNFNLRKNIQNLCAEINETLKIENSSILAAESILEAMN